MTRDGKLSTRRSPLHDYSSPGTYHLRLPVADGSPALAAVHGARVRLTRYGEEFLAVLGESLHRQRHIQLRALDIQPMVVVMVLLVVSRPNLLLRVYLRMSEWLYRRRMALIPLFVGHVKMNSARRINALRGAGARSYWREGYSDRVLTDEDEIGALVQEVGERLCRLYFGVEGGDEGLDGLLLGYAFVISYSENTPIPGDADSCIRSGRMQEQIGRASPTIRTLGVGRTYLPQ